MITYQLTMNRSIVGFHFQIMVRAYSSATAKPKPIVSLVEKVSEDLQHNVYKPRQHPGTDKAKCITLPSTIVTAIFKSLKDSPVKAVYQDAQTLNRYLKGRHIPPEPHQIQEKQRQIEEKIRQIMNIDETTDDDKRMKTLETKVLNKLRQQTYHWKPIVYDYYKSLQYLLGRSAQEYSTILRIFTEIQNRDPEFKPKSYFDFGSGVGTGIWAASNLWKNSIYEYYLVDSSRDMNDLADLILRDGEENKQMELKNVNFRQFFPASVEVTYDIVLCAYSLLELPNVKTRLETLLSLWNKCDGYLIIVEQGSMAGFKLVTEARDFILHVNKTAQSGHVFAPCPSDTACPRVQAHDGTPCNFISLYTPLDIENLPRNQKEMYSYVVLKKGPKNENDAWPRIVRPTLIRSKHSICRMCTKNGKLEEVIFTQAKHGQLSYRCARSSKWGDRLPINIDSHDEHGE